MCLAMPGRVIAIEDDDGLFKMGIVDFDGVRQRVVLNYVPEACVDDYVIVHVGFAISRVRAAEALRSWAELRRMLDHEIPD